MIPLAQPISSGRFSRPEQARLAIEILVLHARVRRSLRGGDLEAALAATRAPKRRRRMPTADEELDRRLGHAVERTLARIPRRSRCLIQSLVLTGLLARRGLDSALVIGVSPAGAFAAHAWVERNGRPLLPEGTFGRLTDL